MDVVKKKILFIVPSMRGGGSERVISILLKYLNRDKFDITLVLLKKEGQYLDNLPKDLKIVDLNVKQARYALFKIIKQIKIQKPDIVFSTLGYLNVLMSTIRPFFSKKIKFIARESSIVSINNQQEEFRSLFDFLYRKFYKNFDLIISQSKFMKDDLVKNYFIAENKIKVINNPVDIEKINQLSSEKIDSEIELLAIGRLDKNKNFKDIIKALPQLNKKLTILGDGYEKETLQKLANSISADVEFLGFQDNPYKYMKNAKLLIITSLYEGFPNVVLEANACGLPVVAFNCPGGTAEIIEDGLNGFLVECGDIDKLVEKMNISSQYSWNCKQIKSYIKEHYAVKKIIKEYEDTFN